MTRRTAHSPASPAPAHVYPLSLHDALPIYLFDAPVHVVGKAGDEQRVDERRGRRDAKRPPVQKCAAAAFGGEQLASIRSEEHTSELQSRPHLVCRLLLAKKNSGEELRRSSS